MQTDHERSSDTHPWFYRSRARSRLAIARLVLMFRVAHVRGVKHEAALVVAARNEALDGGGRRGRGGRRGGGEEEVEDLIAMAAPDAQERAVTRVPVRGVE